LSFVSLDKYLYGSDIDGMAGRSAALKELFGDEYMKGVETLHSALKIAQRESVAPNYSNTSTVANALADLSRIWTGMFTAKGRALTAARRISERSSNRALLNALLDPEKMKLMQKLSTLTPGEKTAHVILGQLGALGISDE